MVNIEKDKLNPDQFREWADEYIKICHKIIGCLLTTEIDKKEMCNFIYNLENINVYGGTVLLGKMIKDQYLLDHDFGKYDLILKKIQQDNKKDKNKCQIK